MGRTLWATERQRSPHRKNIQDRLISTADLGVSLIATLTQPSHTVLLYKAKKNKTKTKTSPSDNTGDIKPFPGQCTVQNVHSLHFSSSCALQQSMEEGVGYRGGSCRCG